MQQYGFDHVHLITLDAEKSARFYENNFGARRVGVRTNTDGSTGIELNMTGMRFLLLQRPGKAQAKREAVGKSYGMEHFGIKTNDIEAAVGELKAAGVEFHEEIRMSRAGTTRIAYFWGPDNELVELVETKTG